MRILHTSDWHLGKSLEHVSRLDEQKLFVEELTQLVYEENIDLIIISGDIYDTSNPSAAAEKLFYKSLKSLSDNGKRPIFIIAGNHDSPERLTAAGPLIEELGIIIVGTPKSIINKSDYNGYSIVNSGEGYVEIKIKNENIIILAMPYPSDKTLNEIISTESDESLIQKDYSKKIGEVFKKLSKNYKDNTINIAVGHFHVRGGETSKSERDIQIGGSMAVNIEDLPKSAQYIAMGHLHRPQKIKGNTNNVYYSGSPIQYSKSEIGYSKSVYIVELFPNEEAVVSKRYLKNYKPIEIWKAQSIEEAILMCHEKKHDNAWVFLEIKTDRVLTPSEIKEIKTTKKDIIEISPIFDISQTEEEVLYEERSIEEEFLDFYKQKRGVNATNNTLEVFLKMCNDIDL